MYPLAIYQGDSYRWQFVLWEDEEKTRPVDLTDTRAVAVVRLGEERYTLDCEVILPNTVFMTIAAEVSAQMVGAGTGLWDLRLIRPNSEVHTVVRGNVSVTASVTYAPSP